MPATDRARVQGSVRPPVISVVVPVLNDAGALRRCLARIAANDYPRECVELIVADNGSTDGSVQVGREAGARVHRLPGRRVSEVRNAAARRARGEVIAFIDADHEIATSWMRAAVDTLQRPGIAAAGDAYRVPAASTWVQRIYDAFRDHQPGCHDVEWLPGGNLAVWRRAFERVGGFDPTLDTCEDVELCARLRAHTGRVVSDDRLRSVHHGDPATLHRLFFSELWRGRDNLRVAVRTPPSYRGLPSIVIPIANLSLLAIALGSLPLAWMRVVAWPLPLLALGAVGTLCLLRAGRVMRRLDAASLGTAAQAFAVCLVYDIARALALVTRAGHGVRRTSRWRR